MPTLPNVLIIYSLMFLFSCNDACEVWVSGKGKQKYESPHDDEIVFCDNQVTTHSHNTDISDDGKGINVRCIKNKYVIKEEIIPKNNNDAIIYVLKNTKSRKYDLLISVEMSNDVRRFDDSWLKGDGYFNSLEDVMKFIKNKDNSIHIEMISRIRVFGTEYSKE